MILKHAIIIKIVPQLCVVFWRLRKFFLRDNIDAFTAFSLKLPLLNAQLLIHQDKPNIFDTFLFLIV